MGGGGLRSDLFWGGGRHRTAGRKLRATQSNASKATHELFDRTRRRHKGGTCWGVGQAQLGRLQVVCLTGLVAQFCDTQIERKVADKKGAGGRVGLPDGS